MRQTSFLRKRQILIVDDQPETLEIMRLHFEEQGYIVATAVNGMGALKKARALNPGLILLDAVLPDVDGFAVCEVLRRSPDTSTIPIIMVSGLSGQMPRCAGIEAGATDFVTKPVSLAALSFRVKQILDLRSTRRAESEAESIRT